MSNPKRTARTPSGALPSVRLRRLAVRRYRGVVPTTLTFDSDLTIILGQNASGKTTLLNLASAALRSDFSEFDQDEYDLGYEIGFPGGTLSAAITNARAEVLSPGTHGEAPDSGLAAVPTTKPNIRTYTYVFTLSSGDGAGVTRIAIEGTTAQAVATIDGDTRRDIPPVQSSPPGPMSGLWSLHNVLDFRKFRLPFELFRCQSYRFDESLEAFRAMTGEQKADSPAGPPSAAIAWRMPTQGAPSQPGSIELYYIASAIVSAMFQRARGAAVPTTLFLTTDELPFLNRAAQLLGFSGAEWKSDADERLVARDSATLTFRRFTISFKRQDNSYLTHDLLSYGQKRLLSFLYYLDASEPGPVIADEIVNGMHHRWIDASIDLLAGSGRQALLTSQNPLLLDYMSFRSAQDVRATFVVCRSSMSADGCRMTWGPMDEAEAAGFFAEYEAGIEQVGEILRRRGLW